MKATLAATILAILAHGSVASQRLDTALQGRAPRTNGSSFTLNQVKNKNFQGHNGPMAFLRAHYKYAEKLPDYLSKLVESNADFRIKYGVAIKAGGETGTVEAVPSFLADSEYAVIVDIGTPRQSLPLNLDTGSSDFWVFSTDTNASMVHGQVLYRANDSSTSHFLPGEAWKIKYGDNSTANGYVYTDMVWIGQTHVAHQAVQVAVNVTEELSSDDFVSGIMGLANSAANTVRPTRQRTYIDNVKDDLALPLFTANLRRQAPGNYNFGYIDNFEYTGDIAYTPINRAFPLWMVAITGYRIGKSSRNESIPTIVDTGTSLMLLPEAVVASYYTRVRGSQVVTGVRIFPCDADLPDFYLEFGSYRAKVPGRYMNYAPLNEEHCFGGLQSAADLPFSVLGDVFIKAQFVVFDYGNARVGFAKKDLLD